VPNDCCREDRKKNCHANQQPLYIVRRHSTKKLIRPHAAYRFNKFAESWCENYYRALIYFFPHLLCNSRGGATRASVAPQNRPYHLLVLLERYWNYWNVIKYMQKVKLIVVASDLREKNNSLQ
jgi:hypothetical protein